jgi:hypothetical protein
MTELLGKVSSLMSAAPLPARKWPPPAARSMRTLTHAGTMYCGPPPRMAMPFPLKKPRGYSGASSMKCCHCAWAARTSALRSPATTTRLVSPHHQNSGSPMPSSSPQRTSVA